MGDRDRDRAPRGYERAEGWESRGRPDEVLDGDRDRGELSPGSIRGFVPDAECDRGSPTPVLPPSDSDLDLAQTSELRLRLQQLDRQMRQLEDCARRGTKPATAHDFPKKSYKHHFEPTNGQYSRQRGVPGNDNNV